MRKSYDLRWAQLCFLTSSLSLLLPAESTSFPLLSLEDEGIFTTSSSAASTPQSQDTAIQEVNILPNEASPGDEGTANTTDAWETVEQEENQRKYLFLYHRYLYIYAFVHKCLIILYIRLFSYWKKKTLLFIPPLLATPRRKGEPSCDAVCIFLRRVDTLFLTWRRSARGHF